MIDLDDLDAKADTFTPDDTPRKATPVLDRLARQHDRPAIDFTKHNRATPKMIGYVMVLLRKLDDHNPDVAAKAREWWMSKATTDDTGRVIGSTLTFDQVSDVITRLKGHMDAPAAPATPVVDDTPKTSRTGLVDVLRTLPEARYALPVLDDAGNPVGDKHRYFKIKISKRTGNPYLVEGHGGANGDLVWNNLVKFEDGALTVAQRLATDPHTFIVLFGHKTSCCGDCGRSLTNDESRRLGIGPYCRGKAVWAGTPWYDAKAETSDARAVDDDRYVGTRRGSHADCDHPRTPAARAACRASRS